MLKYLNLDKLLPVLALCLLPALALAQEELEPAAEEEVTEEVVEEEEEEKEEIPFRLMGVRLGVDLARQVSNLVEPDGRYYEANMDMIFGRYLLSADLGTGRQVRLGEDVDYRTSGTYFRIGPDINIFADSKDWNAFFVGMRFGYSTFEEQLSTTYFTPGWDTIIVNPHRQANAFWFEGVSGLKARIWKGIFLGYTMRLKFGLNAEEADHFIPYEVPGFGTVGDGSTFSFSYHISYLIPFRRDRIE